MEYAPTRRALLSGILGAASAIAAGPSLASGIATHGAQSRSGSGMTGRDLIQIDRAANHTSAGLPDTRGLWLRNPHTGEEITTLFWVAGQYDNGGYTQICRIMRDWRQEAVARMDPVLLHLLWAVQRGGGFTRPLGINSAYRTVKTNRMLMAEGAAVNSWHLKCKAVDLTLDGVQAPKVAEYAHAMKIGGVGYYPTFTHLDTGPIRTWRMG